jgi:hypothetical protein
MNDHQKPSVSPQAVRRIVLALFAVCAICVALDFTYTKHGHYAFENIPGFHAAYGFVSCVLLVIAATFMRRFVKRDEDYYDD